MTDKESWDMCQTAVELHGLAGLRLLSMQHIEQARMYWIVSSEVSTDAGNLISKEYWLRVQGGRGLKVSFSFLHSSGFFGQRQEEETEILTALAATVVRTYLDEPTYFEGGREWS